MHSVYNMQRDQWLANNNGTLPAWALEFDDFAVNPDGHQPPAHEPETLVPDV